MPERDCFLLDDYRIEPALHRVCRNGTTTHVEPRVMKVLLRLAEQPGTPITREALLDAGWSGDVVSDEALTKAVSQLRKALKDQARQPRFIETIPKVGYRLLVSPTPAAPREPDRPSARRAPRDAARPRRWRWLTVAGLALIVASQWFFSARSTPIHKQQRVRIVQAPAPLEPPTNRFEPAPLAALDLPDACADSLDHLPPPADGAVTVRQVVCRLPASTPFSSDEENTSAVVLVE